MKLTLTILFCIAAMQSFAQVNFQPGSIQKNNGETVQGWTDYRAWGHNPEAIRFKQTEDGAVSTFTLLDLSAFTVTGKDIYKRAIVLKDMRPTNMADLTFDTRDSSIQDTAFLRVVTEGRKLSLYELKDEKTHFYIKDSTDGYKELVYKLYLVESGSGRMIQSRPIFRDQLRIYVLADLDLQKLESRLDKLRYDEDELGALINKINGGSASVTFKRKRGRSEFFVSGGISYATIKPVSDLKFGGLNYSSSTSPTFGVGLDLLSTRQLNALVIRVELLYSSWNFEGTGSGKSITDADLDWNYELKVSNITPSLSLLFSPLRAPSYRIYGGVGVGYNFSTYPKNTFTEYNHYENKTKITENFLVYQKGWLGANAHVGGIWKNWELILSTRLFGSFERFSAIEVTVNTYSMRLGYHF